MAWSGKEGAEGGACLVDEVAEAVAHGAGEAVQVGAPPVRAVLLHAPDDALRHQQPAAVATLNPKPCGTSSPPPSQP